jgi:hypothetical protein
MARRLFRTHAIECKILLEPILLVETFFEHKDCERVQGCLKASGGKAPVVERVAALALQLGGKHLADYGATISRHDFTQRQPRSCLILRAYLKTTYHEVLELLAVSPSLRRCLGLGEKLPHYSTLAKFSDRRDVLAIAEAMMQSICSLGGSLGATTRGGGARQVVRGRGLRRRMDPCAGSRGMGSGERD